MYYANKISTTRSYLICYKFYQNKRYYLYYYSKFYKWSSNSKFLQYYTYIVFMCSLRYQIIYLCTILPWTIRDEECINCADKVNSTIMRPQKLNPRGSIAVWSHSTMRHLENFEKSTFLDKCDKILLSHRDCLFDLHRKREREREIPCRFIIIIIIEDIR